MKVEEQLIRGYLDRLALAAEALPQDRRRELVADVTEHLAVALGDPAVVTEADRRQILDRLGEPEEIVRAALEDQPVAAAAAPLPPARRSSGVKIGLIIAAIVLVIIALLGFVMANLLSAPGVDRAPTPSSLSVVPAPVKSPTG